MSLNGSEPLTPYMNDSIRQGQAHHCVCFAVMLLALNSDNDMSLSVSAECTQGRTHPVRCVFCPRQL